MCTCKVTYILDTKKGQSQIHTSSEQCLKLGYNNRHHLSLLHLHATDILPEVWCYWSFRDTKTYQTSHMSYFPHYKSLSGGYTALVTEHLGPPALACCYRHCPWGQWDQGIFLLKINYLSDQDHSLSCGHMRASAGTKQKPELMGKEKGLNDLIWWHTVPPQAPPPVSWQLITAPLLAWHLIGNTEVPAAVSHEMTLPGHHFSLDS